MNFVCKAWLHAFRDLVMPSEISMTTDEPYTDAELARVSVLILDVTKTAYVSPVAKRLASVMKNFNKKIDRKNLNFVNKTAI